MQSFFGIPGAKAVIGQFKTKTEAVDIYPMGEGHINDTYRIKTGDAESPGYVLQRINHEIFRDVSRLMENIDRVTRHINRKKNADENASSAIAAPELILTLAGNLFHKDAAGNHWRCYAYCPHKPQLHGKAGKKTAFEGGRAIGIFQSMLVDLPGGRLHDTIPDFHNLKYRMVHLRKAVTDDLAGRKRLVKKDLDKLFAREEEMMRVYLLEQSEKIPERITHNDTKFNNILFDENGRAVYLIDLDTVMNGSVLYDFGDAVRTLCNSAEEDEKNLSLVDFDTALFSSFAGGYLSETRSMLTKIEVDLLAFSCKLMTYIMAVRFLTDFIHGDVYFKTAYPSHNLNRARNQIRLLECMEAEIGIMEENIRLLSVG
jgi:Ser/Thr protein kinase RdoA (MazF antagonist)